MEESGFRFDFGAARVKRLDDPEQPRPEGMKLVDFVIEEASRLILLEVKSPPGKSKGGDAKAEAALARSRDEFVKALAGERFIADELTPKARDSYTYLHLMKRDSRPMVYVFLLGTAHITVEPGLLLGFKDRLLKRLRMEAAQPWARQYVSDCLILTEQTWPLAFPSYALLGAS